MPRSSSNNKIHGYIEAPEIMTAPGDHSEPILRYRWVPPSELRSNLPTSFHLEIYGRQTPGGLRFYLQQRQIPQAFTAGLAILIQERDLSPEYRNSYRAMWLIWQRLFSTREYLGNEFNHPASLVLRRQAGGNRQTDHIIPETVGITTTGNGTTWTVQQLIRAGEQYLRDQNLPETENKSPIWAGLTRAAILNPLRLQSESVKTLIRDALIAPSDLPPLLHDAELVVQVTEQIEERLLTAIHRHLDDDQEAFNRWFQEGNNTLIQQLAKQKKAPGGPLSQEVVRHVMSELSWRAYQHVGDCIHAVMQAFRSCLGDQLTEEEHRAFERKYECQAYYGGLPAILLGKRLTQLQFILPEVYETPDNREAIAVMHRLLNWYAELACSRRQADRRGQASRAQNSPTGRGTMEIALPDHAVMPAPATDRGNPALDELAERLARQRNQVCQGHPSDWGVTVLNQGEDRATLELGCRTCHAHHQVVMSIADLRRQMLDSKEDRARPG